MHQLLLTLHKVIIYYTIIVKAVHVRNTVISVLCVAYGMFMILVLLSVQ